jgi:hypothetical protein
MRLACIKSTTPPALASTPFANETHGSCGRGLAVRTAVLTTSTTVPAYPTEWQPCASHLQRCLRRGQNDASICIRFGNHQKISGESPIPGSFMHSNFMRRRSSYGFSITSGRSASRRENYPDGVGGRPLSDRGGLRLRQPICPNSSGGSYWSLSNCSAVFPPTIVVCRRSRLWTRS